jgi:hypothetical protein
VNAFRALVGLFAADKRILLAIIINVVLCAVLRGFVPDQARAVLLFAGLVGGLAASLWRQRPAGRLSAPVRN